MNLNQKTLRNCILGVIAVLAILAVFSPFLIENTLSRANFILLDFLIVTLLWKNFDKLRRQINKEELEDKRLTEFEHDIEIRNSLIPEDNNEKNN